MNTWVTDRIPVTGTAYRQLIVGLDRENRRIKDEPVIRAEWVKLALFPIHLPPLRDRMSDLKELVPLFIGRFPAGASM